MELDATRVFARSPFGVGHVLFVSEVSGAAPLGTVGPPDPQPAASSAIAPTNAAASHAFPVRPRGRRPTPATPGETTFLLTRLTLQTREAVASHPVRMIECRM